MGKSRASWLRSTFLPSVVVAAVALLALTPVMRPNGAYPTAAKGVGSPSAATTLLETWDIAAERISYWHEDAELVALESATHPDHPDTGDGTDGRLRAWTARATSKSTALDLIISITDGQAAEAWEDSPNGSAALVRPNLDSPLAYTAAAAALPSLSASRNGKSPGIRYFLARAQDDGLPVIRVVGAVFGLGAIVEINGSNGVAVARYQQDFDANGALLFSEDGGVSWHASAPAKSKVTSIALSSDGSMLFGASAGAAGVSVQASFDAGVTWSELASLPIEAGTYPHDIAAGRFGQDSEALLVGTSNGLWVSKDAGQSWQHMGKLGTRSAWSLAVGEEHGITLAYVSMVSGPNQGELFSSADLETWERRGSGVFRLSEPGKGSPTFAVDDSTGGDGSLLANGRLNPVNLPIKQALPADEVHPVSGEYILRAAGGRGRYLVQSQTSILVTDDGQSWRKTLEGRFASLAASPSFDADGVAVAGGFRDGVYRTSDWGETWKKVLASPSDVTPCNGLAGIVLFVDEGRVVLLVPPTLVWKQV